MPQLANSEEAGNPAFDWGMVNKIKLDPDCHTLAVVIIFVF